MWNKLGYKEFQKKIITFQVNIQMEKHSFLNHFEEKLEEDDETIKKQ